MISEPESGRKRPKPIAPKNNLLPSRHLPDNNEIFDHSEVFMWFRGGAFFLEGGGVIEKLEIPTTYIFYRKWPCNTYPALES